MHDRDPFWSPAPAEGEARFPHATLTISVSRRTSASARQRRAPARRGAARGSRRRSAFPAAPPCPTTGCRRARPSARRLRARLAAAEGWDAGDFDRAHTYGRRVARSRSRRARACRPHRQGDLARFRRRISLGRAFVRRPALHRLPLRAVPRACGCTSSARSRPRFRGVGEAGIALIIVHINSHRVRELKCRAMSFNDADHLETIFGVAK